MKRFLFICAALGAAAVLGGCSSLSQPEEFRVVKDSPIPPPKPVVAAPMPRPGVFNPGALEGKALPNLRRPTGKKSGG